MGCTDDVISLGSIAAKFASFGFETLEVDGHDEVAIDSVIRHFQASTSTEPKALIAKTVKGKGVPFMEHNNIWHYTRLDEQTYLQALAMVVGGEQ